MIKFVCFLFVFISCITFSQNEDPTFPGGLDSLNSWISVNSKNSYVLSNNYEFGRVIVSFVVEPDGLVTNPRIDQGVSKFLDSISLDLVSKMPRWKPSKSKVRAKFKLPIFYEIQDEFDPSLLKTEWIFCTNDTNYYFDSKSINDTTVFMNSKFSTTTKKSSFIIKLKMYAKDNKNLLDLIAIEDGLELSEKNLEYFYDPQTTILSYKQGEQTVKFKVVYLSNLKMTLISLY